MGINIDKFEIDLFDIDLSDGVVFDKWVEVSPKTIPCLTGCGIIVDVDIIPESQQEKFYGSKRMFTLLTDFGNTMKLTEDEIECLYEPVRLCRDPLGRLKQQQDNLYEAELRWFGDFKEE